MNVVLVILAALLGVAALGSGIGKLSKQPQALEGVRAVGVADGQIPILGSLEILGAIGLLVGIWIPLIGIAAAVGLTLYFLGAVIFHVRAKVMGTAVAPAAGLFVLSLIVALLEFAR